MNKKKIEKKKEAQDNKILIRFTFNFLPSKIDMKWEV